MWAQTRSDRADRRRCVISSLFTNIGAALLTEPVWLPDCAGRAEEARCFRLLLQVSSCWKWNLFHCFCCQCYDQTVRLSDWPANSDSELVDRGSTSIRFRFLLFWQRQKFYKKSFACFGFGLYICVTILLSILSTGKGFAD